MRIISGKYRGMRLNKVTLGRNIEIRPTLDRVRESIFSMLQFDIEGKKIADLFAGTGAIGIESLSRGAQHVTFIDSSGKVIQGISENLNKLSVPKEDYFLEKKPFERFLLKTSARFDIIFLDPPYNKGFVNEALFIINDRKLAPLVVVERSVEEPIFLKRCSEFYVEKEKVYGDTVITVMKLRIDGEGESKVEGEEEDLNG